MQCLAPIRTSVNDTYCHCVTKRASHPCSVPHPTLLVSIFLKKSELHGRAREILSSDSEAQSLEEEIQWPAAWLLLLTECPATALSLTLPRDPSR